MSVGNFGMNRYSVMKIFQIKINLTITCSVTFNVATCNSRVEKDFDEKRVLIQISYKSTLNYVLSLLCSCHKECITILSHSHLRE